MAKLHPLTRQDDLRLDDRKDVGKVVAESLKMILRDESDRVQWIAAKREAYDRRYASSLFDKPQASFPWIGASNFNLGLSDVHIEEMKPAFMNLIFGSRRIYECIPMNAQSFPNAYTSNLALDSLIKFRMPDYLYQKSWTIDSLGTYGIGTEKVYYSYITRHEEKAWKREDLPGGLSRMLVVDSLKPGQREEALKQGALLITREEFDQTAEMWEEKVMEIFELDKADKTDKKALTEVMRFLRAGSSQGSLLVKTRKVVEDTPRLVNIPVQNLVVPRGVADIRYAPRICEWLYFTEQEMKQRGRDNVWDKGAVDQALAAGPARDPVSSDSNAELALAQLGRAHLAQDGTALFRLAEIYTYWDIDGDGLDERVVFTVEPKRGTILKAIPWNDEWPYVDTFLEATDQDRHSARGIPEQICDLERHGSAMMRAEENGLNIETAPMFTYLEDSGFNPMDQTMMPGLMVPVTQHDALQKIEMRPTSLVLEGPIRNLLSLSERRVSGSNRAFLDQPPPERRTATEVGAVESARQRVLTVRAMLFQEAQKRSGKMIFDLFRRWGPDAFWVHVTGKPPMRLEQKNISGDYSICPVGAAGDTDPEYRANRALRRLQLMMQMAPVLAGDIRYQPDLPQALIDYFNEDDPLATPRLIHEIPPQQQQAILEQQQAEAQRLAGIKDTADKLAQNAPVTQEEGNRILKEIRSNFPHKELQYVLDKFKAANTAAQQNGARMALQGAGQGGGTDY